MKCSYCKKEIPLDLDCITIQTGECAGHYHKSCMKLNMQRRQLGIYICEIFGLQATGPRINQQISSFIKKGYTYTGIYWALKYFYEVKHHKDIYSYEDKTIGIVPYVYDEANEYFTRVKKIQSKVEQGLQNKQEDVVVVNIPAPRTKKKKQLYDLNEL